jgi:hypothetical protein
LTAQVQPPRPQRRTGRLDAPSLFISREQGRLPLTFGGLSHQPTQEFTVNKSSKQARRKLVAEPNPEVKTREELEAEHGTGNVWDTREFARHFIVTSVAYPFVVVKGKSDGIEGIILFQHQPRYYFGFRPT